MNLNLHLIAPLDSKKWNPIWVKCFKTFKKLPYKILIWDDEQIDNLLIKDDKFFFQKLIQCPKIYKYDYARYVILEKYGGVYLDMDVEIIKDFSNELKLDKLYVAEGFAGKGFEPNILICTGTYIKSLFWYFLKLSIKKSIYNEEKEFENIVSNTTYKTGPWALSDHIFSWNDNTNLQILPWELFGKGNNDFSYAKHHYTNSWWD